MCMETPAKPDEERSLMHELILLADDFSDYTCVSSFLCSALAAVMSTDEPLQAEVIEGAKRCTEMLQSRTRQLKQDLHHVCELYRLQQGKVDLPDR